MVADSDDFENVRARDYWKELVARISDTSKSLDNLVTTLAAGALALSLTFIKDIAPHPSARWALFASWALLCMDLLFTLTSLMAAVHAHHALLNELSKLPEDETIDTLNANNSWAKASTAFTWAGFIALILGTALLLVFSSVNLSK